MESQRCPQCGFLDWGTASHCKRCQYAFEAMRETPESAEPIAEPFESPDDVLAEGSLPLLPPVLHNLPEAEPRMSLVARLRKHRNLIFACLGLIAIVSLLNQTTYVSAMFLSEDVKSILQTLEERSKDEGPKVAELSSRVHTLTAQAGRGRTKAIEQLVELGASAEAHSARIRDPQLVIEEKRNKSLSAPNQLPSSMFTSSWDRTAVLDRFYDPGRRGSYFYREASVDEYVGDILARMGEPAVQSLIDKLKSIQARRAAGASDWFSNSPRSLMVALGRLKSPRAVDFLVAAAKSEPFGPNNIKAVEALSFYEAENPKVLEVYDLVLKEATAPSDENQTFCRPYAIRVAAIGLQRMKSPRAAQILLSHLDLGYWEESQMGIYIRGGHPVIAAVARLGQPAVEPLLQIARDTTAAERARRNAIICLGKIKAEESIPDLISFLDSYELHKAAAKALVEIDDPKTIVEIDAAKARHGDWMIEFDEAISQIKS
jgi:HEAT repeat protein